MEQTDEAARSRSEAVTSSEASLTWVVVDGALWDVSEFAHLSRKDRPTALCPQCGRSTILKLGKVRAHHAAHKKDDACAATAPETALHLNAKFHLARELRQVATVNLREACQSPECEQVRQRAWAVSWDAVE
ncbi:MAG: competence protein CoiA family protein, partial [Planctomycetota bacterium]